MRKYWAIIKTEFQRQLTYRLNFVGYRLTNFIEIGGYLVIWTAVFRNSDMVGGYSYPQMITYVIVSWIIGFLTASYGFEYSFAFDIREGRLSSYLLRPMRYLTYKSVLSVGRASIALITGLLTVVLIAYLVRDWFLPPAGGANVAVATALVAVGYCVRIAFAMAIGLLAFWTMEVDGVFTFFSTIFDFFAGGQFPLDLLPAWMLKVSFFLPFAYTRYAPTQLYLGRMDVHDGLVGLGIEIAWLAVFLLAIAFIWKKGLRKYESVGI
jgi:ABC-2 type transport system permease protein